MLNGARDPVNAHCYTLICTNLSHANRLMKSPPLNEEAEPPCCNNGSLLQRELLLAHRLPQTSWDAQLQTNGTAFVGEGVGWGAGKLGKPQEKAGRQARRGISVWN